MQPMNAHDIIIRPVITEKNTALMEEGKYTFEVAQEANKPMIKAAVQQIFNVSVKAVNTMNVKGKLKVRRTRNGQQSGYSRSWKKAIVTLAPGERIEIFEDL
jgi:large subunit ribosomal protein L23